MKQGDPIQQNLDEAAPATVTAARTRPLPSAGAESDEQIVIGGAQLILAEKRTGLSLMRTGIGVFALPLGVLSVLVAASKYYSPGEVLHLFVPLLALCLALVVLGTYLVLRSLIRIRHYDQVLHEIKRRHPVVGQYIE